MRIPKTLSSPAPQGSPVSGQPFAFYTCLGPVPDGILCLFHLPPQDDPVTNLNNAFEVAEKYLDIPKMLDAEGEYLPYVQSTPCYLWPYLSLWT